MMKSCSEKWEDMIAISNSRNNFCNVCSKTVFDVTNLKKGEIDILKFQNGGDICVKAKRSQLEEKSSGTSRNKFSISQKKIREIGIVCMLILSNLINENIIIAQNPENDNFHKIEQVDDTHSSIIKIIGKIRNKKHRIPAKIQILNEENLLVEEINIDKGRKFKLELPKGILGKKFAIRIVTNGFENCEIADLAVKNTVFKVKLNEQRRNYIGYF